MVSIIFWLVASTVTCALWPLVGTLTFPVALVIFVVWAVLTWGGILILDSDDFF